MDKEVLKGIIMREASRDYFNENLREDMELKMKRYCKH